MTIESVFTTNRPEVLDLHRAYLDEVEQFHDAREQLGEQWGRRVYFSRRQGSLWIGGLEPTEEDRQYGAVLPDGLRLDKKSGPTMLVPALRSAKGKAIQKEWAKIKVSEPRYPGMIDSVWASDDGFRSYIYYPNFALVEDVLWCYWGTSAERVKGEIDEDGRGRVATGFDSEIWQQRKLSEFYAMKEALEEANKAKVT